MMEVEEIAQRRDLRCCIILIIARDVLAIGPNICGCPCRRSHLIFSIDPKGCEDVDDTLSVR